MSTKALYQTDEHFSVTANEIREIARIVINTYENHTIDMHKQDEFPHYGYEANRALVHEEEEELQKITRNLNTKVEESSVEYISNFLNNRENISSMKSNPAINIKKSEDILYTTPSQAADAFVLNVEHHNGQMNDEDKERFRSLQFKFLEEEFSEEFKIINAASVLRKQFRLTPKPSIKWAQRNDAEGQKTTVGDVLGDYTPAHDEYPDYGTPLSDLTVHDWWNAFYRDDAEAGRITDGSLKGKAGDNAFRMKARREGGILSFSPPDLLSRFTHLGEILGGTATAARAFTNHSNVAQSPSIENVSTGSSEGTISTNNFSKYI